MEGFKETKLGWIPNDWEVKELGDICLFRNGKGHEKFIDPEGEFILVNSRFISTEGLVLKRTSKNLSPLQKNDITIVMSDVPNGRAISKCFLVDKDDCYTLNQRIGCISTKIMDVYFLFKVIDRNKYYLRFDDGITQTNLRKSEILDCPIQFPPLKEQQKIAEILSKWDEAIETTQKLIDTLELRKKGLMQELLTGKKRLAGFTEEWEVLKLKDVAERVTKKNTELNDTVITISAQRGFIRQEDYFKKRVASKTLSGYYLIEKGQFAYNKSYSKGYPMGAFKRLDTMEKAVVTTLYICFEVKNNIDSDFLMNYFDGGLMVKNLARIAQEGGRAHGLLNIGINDFFNLELFVPSLKEQKAISEIITLADNEISEKKLYLEQLKQQKKGLMQQLLTGKKRVKID